MASVIQSNYRARRSFAAINPVVDTPNLIDIQCRSYEEFLQADTPPDEREDRGLQGVFRSVFPISDFNETSSLQFVSYALEKPKYDVQECHARGMTFEAPIKVEIRLIVWDKDEQGVKSIRDIKEQQVYFGAIPLMTEQGTFIINGTERVVVSQLHRSPGAFFDHDRGKSHASGKLLYSARIIPYRGSWIDFEFDSKDILHVRIDRRRKMPATILLRALGYSAEELLKIYYQTERVFIEAEGVFKEVRKDLLLGQRAACDVLDSDGSVIVKEGRKFNRGSIKRLISAGIERIPITEADLIGRAAAEHAFDEETGEIILECNQEITEELIEEFRERGIRQLDLLFIDGLNVGPFFRNTLVIDKCANPEQARIEIYARLRPGDPPTQDMADSLFNNLFFNPERYDLSRVGRLKLNYKFRLDTETSLTVLTKTDILETVRYLLDLKSGKGAIDDIDHLGNRRVRAVGELLENQYRIGLVRMERAIKERMSMSQDTDTLMPHDLINAKPVSAVVREYFGSSQLSQFMDQTNPLSELTHKRRLSALGPGGLTRERAGFEVRDVHVTHYGRICPIETPEGPNIGLIASLSTFARVNEYGFIETPYRKVTDGKVTDEVIFHSALAEEQLVIAQANATVDEEGRLTDPLIECHENGEFVVVGSEEVDFIDVSPNQLVSVAAALIPFLEHDDANRALMGSNMQRQAVPLLKAEAPLVGTGMEYLVARDSGVTLASKCDGVVESVDAGRIVIKRERVKEDLTVKPDIYNLTKYQRSNQGTCFSQRPIVDVGDTVKAGDIIADGPSTDCGELSLGKNVVVAFMPWGGYNFEDSILLSERLVRDDVYTSIHIEEFECVARDTKLGREEITRDIPNVGEMALRNLDDSGIIRIGAEIKQGDILVGKVTPKGETQLSPEEKLLRAIFGEKAGDVRDSSLRVPPGVVGCVIDAKVFSRKGTEKDERTKEIEDTEEARLLKDQNDEIKIIRDSAYQRIKEELTGKTTASKLIDESKKQLIKKGAILDAEILDEVPRRFWPQVQLEDDQAEWSIQKILEHVEDQIRQTREHFTEKINKLRKGDELPPGVIKIVKVSVAIKRKIQVGDKMAGRHGNKGVVSQILPVEDMPFLSDGTPVDMVLNPLGVPSRMNVGQILEVHLGWAALGMGKRIREAIEAATSEKNLRALLKQYYKQKHYTALLDDLDSEDLMRFAKKGANGVHVASPVFDGAKEQAVKQLLVEAGLEASGQTVLFDGRTGESFASDVTVGVMYMLKLHHLVDDKIHSRSIGPYSLVTQQPLGGKTQFGGQRLGEMEVWAMEAYGAAYSLQEFLTVKSDDVAGRTRMYESIVKGDFALEAGLPESFNVLIKELQSLCLNIELLEETA
ncbi:MAG: DNA-directed RNA polymerase subunit beta [Deltaproteobacteria bacterium CG2_30_63_29]|nr:MAG: DNA-directed RNA polymerase subunit beta [Deltaproteobacteria bacterium CG2_30_63_29]PIV99246.1 MAG: DNA-directed RNA polymerase subunit beta [Deltaproteobacteria bacterium CG17_big_fil_post_rev_8_21_14_2_50_63_7]PJB37921.1 MAG: DNA-directed RNA polymerase subunit beta [Deltaproteobacteria bacterium CG_4_9_14_3_um_filter_63_12]